jgi:hypothetical protein
MKLMHRGASALLGLALAFIAAGGPLGCGSEESKMERGLTVSPEEAVPMDEKEMEMTEAERRAKEAREEER